MKSFINVVLLFFILPAFGSKTIIKGNSKDFSGNEITFYTFKDYISNEKLELGYTNINASGNYSFEFEITEVKKVSLKIEDKTTWFFVEPGKVYNINLVYDSELNKGRFYDKQLSLIFSFPIPNELNQQIKVFNQKFDEFIENNTLLFKKRDRSVEPKLKSFKAKTLKEYENASPFVKNYIIYSIASTQNALDVGYKIESNKNSNNTKGNIYLEYLHEKPILYNNPEYMNFFQEFFQGELKSLSLDIKGIEISKAVNEKSSYSALSEALAKYPFLNKDEFKNLFILNGLYEISKDNYFKKEHVLDILNQIEKTTDYYIHKELSQNIILKITKKKFGEGSEAPLFTLKNEKDELIQLSNFKGKPVYINFWTNWSIPAKKEMKVMDVLHKKYKNKIHFISICADNDKEKMMQFIRNNENYNWDFLHIENDKKILDKYKIITFPTYVLLDKNLVVYKFPAGRPGGTAERATEDNIEKDFYNLMK